MPTVDDLSSNNWFEWKINEDQNQNRDFEWMNELMNEWNFYLSSEKSKSA